MLLASPLYVICDDEVCRRAGWTLPAFAAACLEGGARLLQLRIKTGSSRAFLESALVVVASAHAVGAQVIVNDRADIARLAGADGVHVGQDDLSPPEVRRVIGRDPVVGLSTHTLRQVRVALESSASYLATGPVFGTGTKDTGYDAVGLEMVRATAAIVQPRGMPVVAIGGITLDRASAVLDAGADAVAVITDLLTTGDPAARVRHFIQALGTRSADRRGRDHAAGVSPGWSEEQT